jgi:hypothetical protein
MITFKCKRSGNLVSFSNEDDIRGLRQHEGYSEVKDAETNETIEVQSQQAPPEKVLKRMGRPPKVRE